MVGKKTLKVKKTDANSRVLGCQVPIETHDLVEFIGKENHRVKSQQLHLIIDEWIEANRPMIDQMIDASKNKKKLK